MKWLGMLIIIHTLVQSNLLLLECVRVRRALLSTAIWNLDAWVSEWYLRCVLSWFYNYAWLSFRYFALLHINEFRVTKGAFSTNENPIILTLLRIFIVSFEDDNLFIRWSTFLWLLFTGIKWHFIVHWLQHYDWFRRLQSFHGLRRMV